MIYYFKGDGLMNKFFSAVFRARVDFQRVLFFLFGIILKYKIGNQFAKLGMREIDGI